MLWKIWRSKKRKKMSCWNCVSASERMAFTFSLQTCIQIGMCDTSVTAPPGLSVCCHLWGVSSAFARVSISQTVVRPQNSHALPTLNCCQDNFVCKHLLHFRCSSCLFSLLTSLHPPRHLSCILWDWAQSFSLLSPRQGIASAREWCTCDGGRGHRLVGSSSLLDLHFPPLVTHWCAEVVSICWVSVRLPSQPTQEPLTMPQVHFTNQMEHILY